ncbi:MAG TPA: ribonuclease R [bacterium]|nr:ribonuclease R [bacterium]
MGRRSRRDEFDPSEVLRELGRAPGGRLNFHQLADACAIPSRARPRFRKLLKSMLRSGVIVPARGHAYRLGRDRPPPNDVAIEGVVRRHRHGFGFLVPDEERDDLFLSVREMADVFDGDTVRAVPVPGRFGRMAGRVVAVVGRGRPTVTGRYEKDGIRERVLPDPEIFGEPIELVPGAVEPRPGEIVDVEIVEWPEGNRPPVGRIVEILGTPGHLGTILETVIRRHRLPVRFEDDALEQAAALPDALSAEDLAGRCDLRSTPTFTIDGEDARDFDDAVSVADAPGGGWILQVSIADVSHWVPRDSPLDREALERGTSTYLPDRVIPMLPEKLSNGLASLRPDEDRLTLTAEMRFDAEGRRLGASVYESVICSAGRWTYTKVARVLAGEDVPGVSEHRAHVDRLHALMARLRARRTERGALDLDLPEPVIKLDDAGEVADIVRSERNDAHRIIEELMIAANEAVADWFTERDRPTIFRVHAPPDQEKLRAFVEFARAWGHLPEFGGLATSRALGEFLDEVRGLPAERAINHILLRTMMRAEYSDENVGHYGLASERYLHFTSPIRRYPDLIVHRQAKAILAGAREPHDRGELHRIALQSSAREQRSAACEHDVTDVLRASFLEERIGEEADGIIAGVIEEGFFVELLDWYVEGMVRVDDLDDDFYRFVKEARILVGRRRRRRFAIGDPVRVAVQAVHVAIGRVELRLVRGGSRFTRRT